MQTKILRNLEAVMRDGVTLYGDLYRPDNTEKYPVVIMRTPYNKAAQEEGDPCYNPHRLAARGYNVLIQDVRGMYKSGGVFKSSGENEFSDGYDTVEWAAAQPWCDGKVGMFGLSYYGFTQLAASEGGPPHLVATCPWQMSGMNPFSMGKCGNFNVYHITWLYRQTIENLRASDMPMPEKFALIRRLEENMAKIPAQVALLPQRELPAAYVDGFPIFQDYVEFLDKLDDPEFRKRIHCPIDFANMDVAMFHSAGWFDETHEGVLDNYEAAVTLGRTDKMKYGQKLVIGPWVHGSAMSDSLDGVSFGEEGGGYAYGMTELIYRWFDYWLKGIDNGIMDEPKVDLFVMGANRWRREAEWPIARTVYTDYYLSGDGLLTAAAGIAGTNEYRYNPLDPAPSEGSDPSGARVIKDRSSLCARDDVLVYRTEPLAAELEITGRIKLDLFASTDVVDTDFICSLSIVKSDGKIYGLSRGIMRARYRNSVTKPEFLVPGETYEFTVDMGSTSYLFPVGSRIQLDITSSAFPNVDLNLNTADHPGAGKIPAIANTKIHFGGTNASKLILPVLPS